MRQPVRRACMLATCAAAAWVASGCSRARPYDKSPLGVESKPPAATQPHPFRATEDDPPASPRFTNVAQAAGLTVAHFSAADGRFRLVETMGSGVGLIDYDNDGWLDLYVAQGCPLPIDPAVSGYTSRLYHNRRDGTFADVTEASHAGLRGYAQGVAVGDYDADGHDDLYVSGFEGGALLHNNGDGTFFDRTRFAGLVHGGWGTSCAFADLDGDGDLDLYVVNYLAGTVDARGQPTANCNATPGALGYCPPMVFPPEPDVLFRNNGDGTFTDVSRASGIAEHGGNGLGLAIADWDGDGRLDIFVANDRTPNFLFHNLGGLKFEEVGLDWGLAYNERGESCAGMGIAQGDYDGDGRPDLYVTNFYEETNTLYRSAGKGQFVVTTAVAGLAIPSRSKLGFGAGFLDYDNDGWPDLFVANGHVNDVTPLRMPYRMHPQLFHNTGQGRFVEVSGKAGAYFEALWLGRAAAFGDLDNDGDTDIVVAHVDGPPALLRNDTAGQGHFLSLRMIGRGGQTRPVGARVRVWTGNRQQTQMMAAGTSYLSAHDPRLHFGLGSAKRVAKLEVRWPSGHTESWSDLPADFFLVVAEGLSPHIEPARTR